MTPMTPARGNRIDVVGRGYPILLMHGGPGA
jgi:hypothetical protein